MSIDFIFDLPTRAFPINGEVGSPYASIDALLTELTEYIKFYLLWWHLWASLGLLSAAPGCQSWPFVPEGAFTVPHFGHVYFFIKNLCYCLCVSVLIFFVSYWIYISTVTFIIFNIFPIFEKCLMLFKNTLTWHSIITKHLHFKTFGGLLFSFMRNSRLTSVF